MSALNVANAKLGENYGVDTQRDYSTYLPQQSLLRYERHGVDLSKGYPEYPEAIPIYLDNASAIRNEDWAYLERGKQADPEKKALFGAAVQVLDLTEHVGTEIVGLQLASLTDQQKDELALLIAERTVVFFRDQDLSPQKQLELGEYFGLPEIHPKMPHVPDLPGVTVQWPKLQELVAGKGLHKFSFKENGGASSWHTDLVHEHQPAGITHLHLDTIPEKGGDTVWASGYGAYDKLSPALQQFLDGKTAIYRSSDKYVDRNDPLKGPQSIEREHPLVRTHPATGWKSLWVNRSLTVKIVGLEPAESDLILEYLYDVYEKNLDIQVRFKWQPTVKGSGVSALWDNRISQHNAVYDYEGISPRHGTRVSSLAEKPYLNSDSKSRRESLGLPNPPSNGIRKRR